ncbi:zinc finger CCHC domain-containing protein 9-like [Planococcus citri]|uniref:zinc finger CCHC domain-containing protein 9-like n=1 Tax=Planococcus citri TaxID=170843 RepID=UPI0031F9EC43
MTRYTNKPSGRRIPEKATPWNELKNPERSNVEEQPVAKQPKVVKKISWKCATEEPLEINRKATQSVPKKEKNKDNKEYKRRKPLTDIPSIYKDGTEIGIVRFRGFPVKKSDCERLKALEKKLKASGVPREEIDKTLKMERRRAEKALARERRTLCFHCRNSGHMLSECPELQKKDTEMIESGICFKCGSTEHQHMECHIKGDVYKHATCFICKQEGHISKQCPDNPRGLYPEGGGCRVCGDVTHLKKDCPKMSKRKKQDYEVTIKTMNSRVSDALDEDLDSGKIRSPPKKKKKVITM